MITAQEIERYATLGLAIPKQEPYWIEVVVFRKVTFQQMLDYMALAEFGKTRPHDPEQIRSEAYRVLTAANTIGPMCFQEINQYAVSVLSITHISFRQQKSEVDIGESGEALAT